MSSTGQSLLPCVVGGEDRISRSGEGTETVARDQEVAIPLGEAREAGLDVGLDRSDHVEKMIAEDEGFLLALGPAFGGSFLEPESFTLRPSPMTIQALLELAIEVFERKVRSFDVRQDVSDSGEDHVFEVFIGKTSRKMPHPGSADREELLESPFLAGPQSFEVDGTLEQRSTG
ncbi:MAG TPA: hypothetical protein VLQ45_01300 [Thermoanaerobaculia bacterium]|nr:hypothetical protein [Thermoanaerobaculia bacterium]